MPSGQNKDIMNKLQLSTIIAAKVDGDEQFFARKVRAKDFSGLMDPIIGFDHFELTTDTFGPHPHAGMSALSYVFEGSAPYHSIDSLGNDVLVTAGSLLWTWAGRGVVHTEFPSPDGAKVEGLQLFVNIPASDKQHVPQSVFIDKARMPEINEDGLRVKLICGETDRAKSGVYTPDPLTMLHVFLSPGKEFTHTLPAHWSGTVYVVDGLFNLTTNEGTNELAGGMVQSMSFSESAEPITFTGISHSQFMFISGKPLMEEIFSQGAMAMDTQESLAAALTSYREGKMGFIQTDSGGRKVILPI